MSTPQIPQIPQLHEAFRFRPWPIGDPVPWWLLSYLSKEVIFELARVQLEYEKAANAAYGTYINGVQNVLQKAGSR
jgi:hypothetical protein